MQTIPVKSVDVDTAATSPDTQHVKKVRVAVSGFRPFHNVPVNPSWECLKPLCGAELVTAAGTHVALDCTEVTVAYESVERYVHVCHVEQTDLAGPKSCHKLHLHIGVSALQPFLLLERRARRSGYERLDVKDCPAPCLADDTGRKGFGVTHEWDNEALPDELFTNLPLDEINSRLSARWGDRLRLSSNAGLYLCEYIYYSSLATAKRTARERNIAPKPVLFLHIPLATEQKALEEITEFVKDLICTVMDTLED